MNHSYLLRHISYHLHTIVRRFSSDKELTESFCGRVEFNDEPFGEDILSYFYDSAAKNDLFSSPIILSFDNQFLYASVPAKNSLYVIGPIRFSVSVYLKYQCSIDSLDYEWLKTVPLCEVNALISDVLLIYNLYHQAVINENDFLLFNCIIPETEDSLQKHFLDLLFENQEYERIHNPYDQEFREFSSIENGDLEQLKRSLEEDYPGEIGTLAKDPLRHAKNRAIVVITLACRSSIRGGLTPEIAFSLSDSYIQRVEECNDIPTLFHLFHSAEYQYAQMVKELKKQREGNADRDWNPHIAKCKDYIYVHLHSKISVQNIAEELGINPNYLSELFHKCENISLTDFIRQEKINLAKNLLIYSKYSYTEIASYLGFSSQSHFGKQFKQLTELTPRQYRQLYGRKEFMV